MSENKDNKRKTGGRSDEGKKSIPLKESGSTGKKGTEDKLRPPRRDH